MTPQVTILEGHVLDVLRGLPAESVHCCVTSPPYWQKRDYEREGQFGAEATPEDFAQALVEAFEEVRRVLRPEGSLWLNLGDSYAAGGNGGGGSLAAKRGQWRAVINRRGWRKQPPGYKSKDLTLVPFMLAFALRECGWYLRSTIIWWRKTANEPNRLDRPAVSHEYLFLLSKAEDSAVRNPGEPWWSQSVWAITPSSGVDGHPAPMPSELARRCIVAGSPIGGVILDPFFGSGTTGQVALEEGRSCIGIELALGRSPDIAERFWAMVNKAGPVVRLELGPCWVWTGSRLRRPDGSLSYGSASAGRRGRTMLAHRKSWALTNGPIPQGAVICHRCDNPGCVRPDHLFAGSQAQNLADMRKKGRGYFNKFKSGAAHHGAKITQAIADEIRAVRASTNLSFVKLGARFGLHPTTVHAIVAGKNWKEAA